ALAPTIVNTPYSLQLTATGGGTQVWSLASGTLPDGITLSPGGLISGTPTALGSYSFVAKVVDLSSNRTDSKSLTLNVIAALTASAPVVVPPAEVSSPFALTLTAAGGTGPYTFALTQGTLPSGLKLDSATGKIAGVPAVPGPSSSVVTVTDANGLKTTVPLS